MDIDELFEKIEEISNNISELTIRCDDDVAEELNNIVEELDSLHNEFCGF